MNDRTRRGSPVYGMTDAQLCDHWWRRAQWEEAEYQRLVAEARAVDLGDVGEREGGVDLGEM